MTKIKWISVIVLSALGLAAGCHSKSNNVTRNYSMRPVNAVTVERVNISETAEDVAEDGGAAELSNEVVVQEAFAPDEFSPGVASIAELVHSGISEELLFTFIDNSGTPYSVSSEEVIYLRDIGTPEPVIVKLIEVSVPVAEAQSESSALSFIESEPSIEYVEDAPAVQYVEQSANVAAPLAEPSTTVVEHHHYFHDALTPYGSWIYLPEYGNVWRPTAAVVNVNWRPYQDNGRWVYSDNGWYWHSYYSWGWAPFHYGRWHSSPAYGWVWVPGSTWGPAWVSWRSSGSYYGWAPLPPSAAYSVGVGFTYYGSRVSVSFGWGLSQSAYCFVDRRDFGHHRQWEHTQSRTEINKFYGDTTVINNYVVNSNNKTIINRGIDYDEVVTGSREQIRKVSVHDARPVKNQVARAETLDLQQDRIYAYRPSEIENRSETAERVSNRRTPGKTAAAPGPSKSVTSNTLRERSGGEKNAVSSVNRQSSRAVASTTGLESRVSSQREITGAKTVPSRTSTRSTVSATSTKENSRVPERSTVGSRTTQRATSTLPAKNSSTTSRTASPSSTRKVVTSTSDRTLVRTPASAQSTVRSTSKTPVTTRSSSTRLPSTATRTVISSRQPVSSSSKTVVDRSSSVNASPQPTIIRSVRSQQNQTPSITTSSPTVNNSYQRQTTSRPTISNRTSSIPTVQPRTTQPSVNTRSSVSRQSSPQVSTSRSVSSPSVTSRSSASRSVSISSSPRSAVGVSPSNSSVISGRSISGQSSRPSSGVSTRTTER